MTISTYLSIENRQLDSEETLARKEIKREGNRLRQQRRRDRIRLGIKLPEKIKLSDEEQILLDNTIKEKEEARRLKKAMSPEEKRNLVKNAGKERQQRHRDRIKLGIRPPEKIILSEEENRIKEEQRKNKKKAAQKAWRLANPDKARAHAKKYRLTNPIDPVKKKAAQKAWRLANPDKARAHTKKYQDKLEELSPGQKKAAIKAWRLANPDKVRAHMKKYQDKLEELRPGEKKAAHKAWAKANPDKVRAHIKKYNDKREELRPGEKKAAIKAYRAANPEKFATYSRTRRAKKRMVASEPYTLQDIQLRHGIDCHICEEPIDYKAKRTIGKKGWESGLHLDHVTPITLGGGNTIENVKPSHGWCNSSKGDKLVEEMGSLENRKQSYLNAIKSVSLV